MRKCVSLTHMMNYVLTLSLRPKPQGATVTAMGLAALVIAIVSAVIAAVALWYARLSASAATRAADAAATTAALDVQRRNAELTPRFRVTCDRPPKSLSGNSGGM
jgi:hypothetical protein